MNFNPWYMLAAIPVFALMVLIHELGHFLAAKWAGIRVDEFGLGLPPRLLSVKRGETLYSLNALPIGGFVRMPGENGEMTDTNGNYDPRSFAAKPASKRLIVLLAGVTMNLLLAFVFFTGANIVGRVDQAPVIGAVLADSPATRAGLVAGDTITSVNGKPVTTFTEFRDAVSAVTDKTPASTTTVPITVEVRHKGASVTQSVVVQALAHPTGSQGHFGVEADMNASIHFNTPFWQAPGYALKDMGNVVTGTFSAIGDIVRGLIPWNKAIQGPVGIVRVTGAVASTVPVSGPYWLLYLVGALNMSLAIFNILPVPALDGGRAMLVVIEILRRGKRLSPEREGLIHLAGFAALILLILVVTFNDVTSLLPK